MRATKQRAFTLIELLVVIGITALLAGLILAGAGIAMAKARQHRVETERTAIETAIEQYKIKKGYYPPDNPANPLANPLYYELSGTIRTNQTSYFCPATQETFDQNTMRTLFNREGFVNSSPDESEIVNFLPSIAKGSRSGPIGNPKYMVLGVQVPGPMETSLANGGKLLPWCYVSTNPTNNTERFDLWMDVFYSGKTNRISNWSPQPQPQ